MTAEAVYLCTACSKPTTDPYQLTRRPGEPVEEMEIRSLGGYSETVQIRGPESVVLCVDCWTHVVGWIEQMTGAKR